MSSRNSGEPAVTRAMKPAASRGFDVDTIHLGPSFPAWFQGAAAVAGASLLGERSAESLDCPVRRDLQGAYAHSAHVRGLLQRQLTQLQQLNGGALAGGKTFHCLSDLLRIAVFAIGQVRHLVKSRV